MDNFKKQILQVVVGLSIDLNHVKKAIGMDSGVLSSYVSKLEMLLDKYWSGWWLPFLFAAWSIPLQSSLYKFLFGAREGKREKRDKGLI
jgi:hypothetical protein